MIYLLAASAAEPERTEGISVRPEADLRLIGTFPDTFALDADGNMLVWGPALDSRLRTGLSLSDDVGRFDAQFDLFTGQFAGALWNLGGLDERRRDTRTAFQRDGFLVRRLSVGIRQRWLDVEAGLQTSQWGLGMLANDGGSDPLFGRTDLGDGVLRARFATMPAGRQVPLFLLVAGDLVIADEIARFSEGDRAFQLITALLYKDSDTEAGLYGVLRRQGDSEALDETRITAVDGTALHRFDLDRAGSDRVRLELGVEGAGIFGHTLVGANAASPDGLGIVSGGLAARATLSSERYRLHQRLALASGDRNPDDATINDFRFDRNYDVGAVLFDEVQSAVDLQTIALASAPSAGGVPPDGIDTLAAEGAFHQALAVQDAIELLWQPLDIRVGGVFAWSTAPIAHPYNTFRNGGVPLNYAGKTPGGRYLGSELDWAVGTHEAEDSAGEVRLVPSLWLQVGHAWPSVSYSGDITRVDQVLVTLRMRYAE